MFNVVNKASNESSKETEISFPGLLPLTNAFEKLICKIAASLNWRKESIAKAPGSLWAQLWHGVPGQLCCRVSVPPGESKSQEVSRAVLNRGGAAAFWEPGKLKAKAQHLGAQIHLPGRCVPKVELHRFHKKFYASRSCYDRKATV